MTVRAPWLIDFDQPSRAKSVDGLILVRDYNYSGPPEVVAVMERAASFGAHAVFFEAGRNGRAPVAQAFIFVAGDRSDDDAKFGEIHKRLWSWGGVPLAYRRTKGLLQLFRCAHDADFVSGDGRTVCNPVRTLELAVAVASSDPWWDFARLRNGTLWEDPVACRVLLTPKDTAHKRLVEQVRRLNTRLDSEGILRKRLRRKLLILSLLIAYLEDRGVFPPDFFGGFQKNATHFFEVLASGPALLKLLDALEERFNGHVFQLEDADRAALKDSTQLVRFAELVEGRRDETGQLTLWQLYSFRDLPVELISHIYQLFVDDPDSSVYTPPFLVRLMLDEALSWDRLDRLQKNDEVILDPSCGSGVFLVEAYKRLVLHWRSRNGWKRPRTAVLKELLDKVRGIDLEEGAVELAAFSLCLALCDALEPEAIRASIKLFPQLAGRTLHHSCFFEAKESGLVTDRVGVLVGNPPFKSRLTTAGARRSAAKFEAVHGPLPDYQLAYLFLHEAMEMVASGGVLSMLQQYNFLYNQQSQQFRASFFSRWDVREVLDFVSVRGLFQKGDADTKVLVIVAEAASPPQDRKILHATFRRSSRVDAEQGFDIDYYDLHWLPRTLVHNDSVWRSDLLGGGRVLTLLERLGEFRTMGDYAEARGWDYGEGFIEASPRGDPDGSKAKKLSPAEHLTGQTLLPTQALTESGIDRDRLQTVTARLFKSPYTAARFSGPMTVVHQQYDLNHGFWSEGTLAYKNQIVGFCGRSGDSRPVKELANFIQENKRTLQAFVAGKSIKLFTQHATTLSANDIVRLPFPESGDLDLSDNEAILVHDIVDYYRDLIRLGEHSAAMNKNAQGAIPDFRDVFVKQINTVYSKKPIRGLEAYTWPGIICQPFVFGKGKVEWEGAEDLRGRINGLLKEQQCESLRVTRIARIYDGNFVFLLKPDRLRYWMRSVALRDADDVLADLRSQGF